MIEIKHLTKTYQNNVHALHDVNLTIEDGDIFGIIGLSGAGKSTLFRSMSLLETVTEGEIIIDGTDVTKLDGEEARAYLSNIGVVFQGYNLLFQKNVYQNIALPLIIKKCPKDDIKTKVEELIKLVGLEGKEKSYIANLSGGQIQRVAIARALARDPKLLLLDEFTSALDPITTKQILNLIKEINEKLKVTVVIITHEMSVVRTLCNNVAVLNYGVIEELGPVSEVLTNPRKDITKLLLGKEV